jgi:phosphatidate cytidylyltransferase
MNLDPLLLRFLPILVLVFGTALLLILVTDLALRRKRPELVQEIWRRYSVWVAIAALLTISLALGRTAWIVGVTLLSFAVFREYAKGVGLWLDAGFQGVVYLFILLLNLTAWWNVHTRPDLPVHNGWYGLFLVMPIYGTLFLFALPVFRGVYEHMLQKLALAVVALIYFGWCLGHYSFMINATPADQPNGVGMILYLSTLVALNDVSAFVWGKLLGRHKLSPKLSPGKTWEGAIGAYLTVLAVGWTLRGLIPFFPTPEWFVATTLIAVGGVFGDLTLSTIKRDLGIKDWGNTLPGHGGLLDRANSLIFTAPIFFHFTNYFFDAAL